FLKLLLSKSEFINSSDNVKSAALGIKVTFDSGTFLTFIRVYLNAGVKTLISFAFLYTNASNQKANLIIILLVTTPVSIADSGHKSLTSKTKGILLNLDKTKAVMPTKSGGDVTKMISYFSFVLKNPAHILEKTKEKYPHNLPKNPLLY